MKNNPSDRHFMLRALTLARGGMFTADPNPRVGCVLVRDGRVVGEGFHARAGEGHAEVNALCDAGAHARGATAYVTLEPCNHHGRTGPCSQALIDAGVVRVVAAMTDPAPHVAGQGFERLRSAGIKVETGLLAAAAEDLNPGFLSRMRRGRPWVRMKSAISLDGKTALANGASFWITGEAARADVQLYRARSACIVTGIGTVLADDPQMTVRLHTPFVAPRIAVVDSHFRLPVNARVVGGGAPVSVFGCDEADSDVRHREQVLSQAGVDTQRIATGADGVDLHALCGRLQALDVNEVMVEAGARLSGSWLGAGLVDEWVIYVAPCVLGSAARPLVAMPSLTEMSQRWRFKRTSLTTLGDDIKMVFQPATDACASPNDKQE